MFIFLIASCSQPKPEQPSSAPEFTEPADTLTKKNAETSVSPLNYYFMDKFAEAPFQVGKPTLKSIRGLKEIAIEEDAQPVLNLHNSLDADSIVTLSIGEGKMVYYTGGSESRLYYARFVDNSIAFKNGIRIGMKKPDFASKFDQLTTEKDLPAVIQIANPNNREVYNFIFYQDTLGMVVYDSYIE